MCLIRVGSHPDSPHADARTSNNNGGGTGCAGAVATASKHAGSKPTARAAAPVSGAAVSQPVVQLGHSHTTTSSAPATSSSGISGSNSRIASAGKRHGSGSSRAESRFALEAAAAAEQPAGCSISSAGKLSAGSVRLAPPAATADERQGRMAALVHTLFMHGLGGYAVGLMQQQEKLALLTRLQDADLAAVLTQEEPQQLLDAVYAIWQGLASA